ncbi:MAG: double zinc ribbon domain-containing protein [Patescibacteria group bacterium]|jgi:competence protein ComFC
MFFIDLLFPKFCLGCGYVGVYLCPSCSKELSPIENDNCPYCNKASLFGLTHPNCSKTHGIDGSMAIYHYNPILKKVIKNIKYRLAIDVWQEFYKVIEPQLISKLGFYKKLSSNFVIQPIPLSKLRYNERGFNQARIISVFFQKILSFPTTNALTRKEERTSQAQTKNKKIRYFNVKDVFITTKFVPENILLIDDVITSGSTVKEAARILKMTGAKKVYALALAKG